MRACTLLLFAAAFLLLPFVACSTTGGGGGVGSCARDADCTKGYLCGFEEEEGCSAEGTCFLMPETRCNLTLAGCACDGSAINLVCNGLPTGYAPKPFAHMGACAAAAAADDGAAGACETDADCGAGRICGFPESAGCSATGACFPAPEVRCMAYLAGCACDGTMVNIACNGLPSGYAPKPLAHRGPCTDGGLP